MTWDKLVWDRINSAETHNWIYSVVFIFSWTMQDRAAMAQRLLQH